MIRYTTTDTVHNATAYPAMHCDLMPGCANTVADGQWRTEERLHTWAQVEGLETDEYYGYERNVIMYNPWQRD